MDVNNDKSIRKDDGARLPTHEERIIGVPPFRIPVKVSVRPPKDNTVTVGQELRLFIRDMKLAPVAAAMCSIDLAHPMCITPNKLFCYTTGVATFGSGRNFTVIPPEENNVRRSGRKKCRNFFGKLGCEVESIVGDILPTPTNPLGKTRKPEANPLEKLIDVMPTPVSPFPGFKHFAANADAAAQAEATADICAN